MPSLWEQYERQQKEREIESCVSDLTQQLLAYIRERSDVHPHDQEEVEGDFHSIEATIDQLADQRGLEFVREAIKRLKERWQDFMDEHPDNKHMAIVEFLDSEIRRFKE